MGALSRRAVADDLAAGRLALVRVDMPAMTRPLAVVWRSDRPLTSAAEAFLRLVGVDGYASSDVSTRRNSSM